VESEKEVEGSLFAPIVEIYIARSRRVSAAASSTGGSESRLSPEQVLALQQTLTSFVSGFHPPEVHEEHAGFRLDSLEVELSFKVETGAGSMLKLLLDASAEASIKANVVWNRPK
jgi:hypothetical protein